jgi:hypothetical protein
MESEESERESRISIALRLIAAGVEDRSSTESSRQETGRSGSECNYLN